MHSAQQVIPQVIIRVTVTALINQVRAQVSIAVLGRPYMAIGMVTVVVSGMGVPTATLTVTVTATGVVIDVL